MRKWSGGLVLLFLFSLLLLRLWILENPLAESSLQSPFSVNYSDYFYWTNPEGSPVVRNPENDSHVVSTITLVSKLFSPRNLSDSELQCLQTWNHLDHLISSSQGLPHAVKAIREAGAAWESLMTSIEEEKLAGPGKVKEKLCPYSIRRMNDSEFGHDIFKLVIPCGLVQGSSITVIGTPGGLLGNFQIDLTGATLPGEPDPPVILHYNVRIHGDKITEDPVIIQNTWTVANDWGEEERCPPLDTENDGKVDDLEQCDPMVGRDNKGIITANDHYNFSRRSMLPKDGAKPTKYFPFRQGYIAIATIRMGAEGIQMSVDGKHITSFAYRESLEPWLVGEVRISGDIQLISVIVSGLPTSEDLEHVLDLDILKSSAIPIHKSVDLFVGVFSTANNFKHRMAVRRTWKQYDVVRVGSVAVRFFVGLTNVLSAKYIMKTDDDAFARVDELLTSLQRANITHGLLYGRINFKSRPNRKVDSKWYITPEEWSEERYPPWAHGPGYVVSHDIAKGVHKQYKRGHLKMFKLEDVAMGIWIEEMKNKGMDINYKNENRINIDGCKAGYVVAHYQEPREMLCLWQKLRETHEPSCCRWS
ncbi:beta-1,3-galactosyltransferase GALT1-like isoform X2 [Musa acuminata AAA Group]|uniref:beta-1,3-galactosyltransferase GALT1-like isoform X2 n=1 Tax=Musa acuminata AAA Group TaxID=214697 RepID=UPI0031D4B403